MRAVFYSGRISRGARVAVLRVKRNQSTLGKWVSGLETRAPRTVVIVATANNPSRIRWAVLASGTAGTPERALAGSADKKLSDLVGLLNCPHVLGNKS